MLDCNTADYKIVANWRVVGNQQGVIQPVNALAFDPNLGVIASGDMQGLVEIWQFEFLKIATTTTSTTTSTLTSTPKRTNTTLKSTTISTTKLTTKLSTKTTTKSSGTSTYTFQKLLKKVRSQG